MSGPQMTDAERTELEARLARMLTKPHRAGHLLLWVERDDSDSTQVMTWQPETPDELRAAELFYDAAHGLGAFAKPVGKGKPPRRSPEEDALIAGILKNRAEDTGYLVYADYLTERGNSQGDFIRSCVQMNRLEAGSPEYDEEDERGGALASDHAAEWFAPLGELGLRPELSGTFTPWLWLSFDRGVIDQVTIDRPGIIPQSADRLFAAAPFLRKLTYEPGHFNGRGLARLKQLPQIEELGLARCYVTANNLRPLFLSKRLTGLRVLNLSGNGIGDEGVRFLCAWAHLAGLEELHLTRCELTAASFARLGACAKLTRLSSLRIGHNVVAGEHAHALFRSPHLSALEELALNGLHVGEETAAGLGGFPRLADLNLESATFVSNGFARLMRNEFPALEVLTLDSAHFSAADMEALAGAPCAARLCGLHLDDCATDLAGVTALLSGSFPKLTTLDLSRNGVGDRGSAILGQSAHRFPALTRLKLLDCDITPEGVAHLVRGKLAANLTHLDLSTNTIGPAGAEALARSRSLKRIKSLTVSERSVGKKGRAALVARFGDSVLNFS